MEIRALTGLRAPLAYWVVLYHFLPETGWRAFDALIGKGHFAVDIFYVLSGYVLTKRYAHAALQEPTARKQFWLRRFARLYPLYFLSLAIGIAAGWPRNLTFLLSTLGQLRTVVQLLLLNAWWHVAMFQPNWAAWSLSVEALFYLLFPALFLALRNLSVRKLAIVLTVASLSLWIAPSVYVVMDPDNFGHPLQRDDQGLWTWYLWFFPVQRLPEFIAGMCCARLSEQLPRVSRSRALLWLLGAFSVSIAACFLLARPFLISGVLTPVFALLLYTLDSCGNRWLEKRALVALGRASYATYILHVPWCYALKRIPGFEVDEFSALQFLLYLSTLTLVSLAAHRCIEEPLRKRITNRFSGSVLSAEDEARSAATG